MAVRITYLIVYKCKHVRMYEEPVPLNGELVWCVQCANEVYVTSSLNDYRIRCENCIYSRKFGVVLRDAEVAASRHSRSKQHCVRVYDGYVIVTRYGERYRIETGTMLERDIRRG
jgi:hypothetical protein